MCTSIPAAASEQVHERALRRGAALDVALRRLDRGVPGLGLKRGLGDDVVIAPYATALALMVDPAQAVQRPQVRRL